MSENSIKPISAGVGELFKEIRQINEQYKLEVPKLRRPWPTSIQARILELWKLGVSTHQIAEETGLPAQTMYSWRQRVKRTQPNFVSIPIIKKRRRRSKLQLSQLKTVTTTQNTEFTTVTVVVGERVRLEGVSIEHAIRIARELLNP